MFKNIDKNTVLGIFLIVLMVGLYTWNLSKKAKTMATQAPTSVDSSAVAKDTLSSIQPTVPSLKDTTFAVADSTPNQQFILENDLIKIEFSSLGGAYFYQYF